MCLVCGSVVCVRGPDSLAGRITGPSQLAPAVCKVESRGFGVLESWRSTRHGSPGPSNSGRMSREHPSSAGMVSVLSRAKARGEKDRGDQRPWNAGLTATTALRRAGAMGLRRTGADVDCALPEQERTHHRSRRVSVSLQVSFRVCEEKLAPSESFLGRGKHDPGQLRHPCSGQTSPPSAPGRENVRGSSERSDTGHLQKTEDTPSLQF